MNSEQIIVSALVLGGGAWWMLSREAHAAQPGQVVDDYSIGGEFDWSFLGNGAAVQKQAGREQKNLDAFLQTIRYAEGTAGATGYNTQYGGGLFSGLDAHPNQVVNAGGRHSSAAGAYQFLAGTWSELAAKLGLRDFSPASQDAAAIELIRRAGALDDVKAGRFDAAADKVRKTWASFPGAGYGQPEKLLSDLRAVFMNLGGSLA